MGLFFARPPKVYPFYSYSTQQQLTEFANLPTHITNSPCVFLDPFHSLHITASHCTTQSPSQTFPNNWHAANSILQTTLFTSPPPTTAYSQLQYCTQPQHTDLLWDWHLLPWTLLRHSYHRQSSQHIDQMNHQTWNLVRRTASHLPNYPLHNSQIRWGWLIPWLWAPISQWILGSRTNWGCVILAIRCTPY
jgi:hypothetical protein